MGDALDPLEHRTEKLLAELAGLINRHGPDSTEVLRFLKRHEDIRELQELGNLSRDLKKALA